MWEGLFGFTNGLAVVGWLLLAFLPRKPLTHSAILYLGIGLLCLIYVVCFGLFQSGRVDVGRVAGAGQPGFGSIPEVRALFMSDAGVVIGWTHYLAFDLFIGAWIVREGLERRLPALLILLCLPLTFLFGPAGLLLFYVLRLAQSALRRQPLPETV